MSMRVHARMLLIAGLAVLLAGCFRQASSDIVPTPNLPTATSLPASATADEANPSFVTPFVPGQGPDITQMPTLGSPAPTLPLIAPETATLPGSTPIGTPFVAGTVPFAAGPTFTPQAGAPPVNLNPQFPESAGNAATSGEASALATPEDCIYVVEPGDNAFHIATIYNISMDDLIAYNNLENADFIFEGQELKIPRCGQPDPSATDAAPQGEITPPAAGQDAAPTQPPSVNAAGQTIHVVQAGENLFRIALRYGVTMQSIVDANGLGSQDAILHVDQELIIPTP